MESSRLAEKRVAPANREAFEKLQPEKRRALIEVLGGQPKPSPIHLKVEPSTDQASQTVTFDTELDLKLFAHRDLPEKPGRLAIVLDLDGGADAAFTSEIANSLRDGGWAIVTPELRTTGRFAHPGDKIGHAPDHNTAEWSLWIGRPLLGQWVYDVRRTLDAIAERDGSLPHDVLAIGRGSSGVVALCAAALDERITRVKTIESLASFVTDQAYRRQRLGLMAPGILRDVGDLADIAALVAPRPVTISGGTTGEGKPLDPASLNRVFATTKRSFELLDVASLLVLEESR